MAPKPEKLFLITKSVLTAREISANGEVMLEKHKVESHLSISTQRAPGESAIQFNERQIKILNSCAESEVQALLTPTSTSRIIPKA
jgi:hypothetical protein